MLVFWVYNRVLKLLTRNDPDFISHNVIQDLNTVQNQTFKDNRFSLALGIYDFGKGKFAKIQPEFGHFEMMQISMKKGKLEKSPDIT